MGKPGGKRPHGRPRCRKEYNIKLDLQEIGWGWAWTRFIWLRIQKMAGSCENDNEY